MSIIYGERHWWYCDVCEDEGESESESGAEAQAKRHKCETDVE